ncbi:MAG: complex I subunit 4 family protein [Candidatus Asgardarchaeia archaeon]
MYMTISILLPILFASILLIFKQKISKTIASTITVLTTVVSAVFLIIPFLTLYNNPTTYIHEQYVWIPSLNVSLNLRLDGLSFAIAFSILFLSILSAIYSIGYMEHEHDLPFYYANYLYFFAGMLGVVLSADMLQFYIFWELMLIPSYFLIAFWGTPEKALKIAIKYFIFMHIGALAILVGILLTYINTGTFDMLQLTSFVAKIPYNYAILIFGLLLFGFLVKMAVFPFHTWLPDAHAEAPTPISVLLSGVMIETAAYAIIRFCAILTPAPYTVYSWSLTLLGAVTIIYGGLMALVQTDIKRLLAYSSVSQMGYVFFGLATYTSIGFTGSMFHIINHAMAKGLLFMVAGLIMHTTGIRNIEQLGGLGRRWPAVGVFGFIGALSIAGAPPMGGFFSEWLIFSGGVTANFLLPLALALVGGILSAGYMLRFLWKVFLGPEHSDFSNLDKPSNWMLVPIGVLAFFAVFFGVFPEFGLRAIVPFINNLFEVGG